MEEGEGEGEGESPGCASLRICRHHRSLPAQMGGLVPIFAGGEVQPRMRRGFAAQMAWEWPRPSSFGPHDLAKPVHVSVGRGIHDGRRSGAWRWKAWHREALRKKKGEKTNGGTGNGWSERKQTAQENRQQAQANDQQITETEQAQENQTSKKEKSGRGRRQRKSGCEREKKKNASVDEWLDGWMDETRECLLCCIKSVQCVFIKKWSERYVPF
ncbi:hypothetical protein QBC41DRAFT_317522, partial [Cercophora samala]